jgi:hypothetical protein
MKAQISLEFMVAVATYLAFLSILIHAQHNIILNLKNNAEMTRNSISIDSADFIISLGKIYSSSQYGGIEYTIKEDCRMIGKTIFCGQMNETTYISEDHVEPLG